MSTPNGSFWRSPFKTILLSGFIAGLLDMSTALLVYVAILQRTTVLKLLQSIASGVFGKDAYTGGTTTALYGLAFHFLIAFSFAIAYFILYPYISLFRKQRLISAFIYGIFVWCVMNLLVLPLVMNRPASLNWNAFLGAAILICMIGLPVSFITHAHYASRNEPQPRIGS
jgi:uncharacterized membrane protein YagU involved in acid resistance